MSKWKRSNLTRKVRKTTSHSLSHPPSFTFGILQITSHFYRARVSVYAGVCVCVSKFATIFRFLKPQFLWPKRVYLSDSWTLLEVNSEVFSAPLLNRKVSFWNWGRSVHFDLYNGYTSHRTVYNWFSIPKSTWNSTGSKEKVNNLCQWNRSVTWFEQLGHFLFSTSSRTLEISFAKLRCRFRAQQKNVWHRKIKQRHNIWKFLSIWLSNYLLLSTDFTHFHEARCNRIVSTLGAVHLVVFPRRYTRHHLSFYSASLSLT